MNELTLGAATALWLGVLTSISPCPLATNIAAISYIGRRTNNRGGVLAAGALYTLGRVLAYVLLAAILVNSALSASGASMFLQRYVHALLGPMLIVVGMFLVGLLQLNFSRPGVSEGLRSRAERMGAAGTVLLGALFALAFCPTSAALFFGSVMASVSARSPVLLPLVYGVGTALPVIVFALLIATGAKAVEKAFSATGRLELWARLGTGAVFILIGVGLTVSALAA